VDRIDRLLAELGDLAQTTSNLEESIARTVEGSTQTQTARAEIRQSLRALDRRIRSLHDGVLSVRKVSLQRLFDRMERVFRDACRQSGKDARYVALGAETELDRSIVEALSEPLTHLIRNAVDHGIEDAAARRAAGKADAGTVRVEARAEGDRLVLELADDGAGIDPERVLARAKALGLVGAAETPGVDEQIALIFRPGLSVKGGEPTELSGRGVGLDVVRESVVRLGGVLDVETSPAGTVFRLRLPRSFAVVAALDVETGGERYFLPLANVVRVVEVENPGLTASMEIAGRTIDVRELRPRSSPSPPARRARPAVLLAVADRRTLFLVDRVGRRRDIVVRALGDWLGCIHGVAGCAETADGRSVVVLDPRALMEGPLETVEVDT
jgi:two-component system chemotaxis sensor kinase CheA